MAERPQPGLSWDRRSVEAHFDVSHETVERLEVFAGLLTRWQKTINLVGPKTLDTLWGRHIADSLQIVALAPREFGTWVDLGSGGGLPGLIVAAALADVPGFTMHLVEANARKCAFLQVAARAMNVPVEIHNLRIEALGQQGIRPRADIISARALAPLPTLLDLAQPFMWKNTVCLFHKGQDVESELTQVARYRTMKAVRIPSLVEGAGSILRIEGATREQEI